MKNIHDKKSRRFWAYGLLLFIKTEKEGEIGGEKTAAKQIGFRRNLALETF